MHYNFNLSLQGTTSRSIYLHLRVDRVCSTQSYYAGGGILCPPKGSLAERLLNSISQVKGVIPKPQKDSSGNSCLLHVNGNEFTIKLSELDPQKIELVVEDVINRVHNILAPNETRIRVTDEELNRKLEEMSKVNGPQTPKNATPINSLLFVLLVETLGSSPNTDQFRLPDNWLLSK